MTKSPPSSQPKNSTIPIPEELINLVERFRFHLDEYKSGHYNETQLRLDYIDPLFKILGWDVHNTHGYAEKYRDVIHEDAVKIGGTTKAPDYSFRIGGQRKKTKTDHFMRRLSYSSSQCKFRALCAYDCDNRIDVS